MTSGSPQNQDEPGLDLIAATFTAFHPDGAVDLDAIERQASDLVRRGVGGVFVCGTTGESASLSTAERMNLAGRWCEVAQGTTLQVIVHVGHTALPEARALAEHAQRAGAAAIAAVAPFYFRPRGVAELVDFCARVAAAAPALPFYYYHIPSLTHVAFPASEVLLAAAEAIPSFGGVKFTHEDLADFARCLELAGDRYRIFFGRDEMLLAGLALGARGAVGSTYNFAAPLFLRMAAAAARGDVATARRDQALARRMIETAVAHGGIPAFKAIMALAGVDCGPCRPPLPTLTNAQAERLRADLDALAFFDAIG